MRILSLLFILLYIFPLSLSSESIKGYFDLYRIEKYDYNSSGNFESYQAATFGDKEIDQFGVGIFGNKYFILSVNLTVGGEEVYRFDKGVYYFTGNICFINNTVQNTSGKEINMTLTTGSSRNSCILFDDNDIIVITDFRDDPSKNYILKLFLRKNNPVNSNIEIKKGWNLISFSNIVDPDNDFNNSNIIVWQWDNSKKQWKAWAYNDKFKTLLNEFNISKIEEIFPAEGIWIYSESDTEISYNAYDIENYEFLKIATGWNLVGVTKDISVNNLLNLLNDQYIQTIWSWDTTEKRWKVWMNFEKYPSLKTYSNFFSSFDTLLKDNGFWIYR